MTETRPVEIEVWFWSLDIAPAERTALSALLSADERARAARFHHARDRERWIVARARMRERLGAALGEAPEHLIFETEAQGRPFLKGHEATLSFNLSHSEGLGALAVSFDARVGVDVEAVRPLADHEMDWPLSHAERAALRGLRGKDRLDAFFRFWTLKEAFIKAHGAGLSLPLGDFDMSPPGAAPRLMRLAGDPVAPRRWGLAEGAPGAGFKAAVAALTDGRPLAVRWHGSCLASSG